MNGNLPKDSEMLARIDERTKNLQIDLEKLSLRMSNHYVRNEDFEPVKKAVYIVGGAVVLAIVAAVLRIVIVV